MTEIVPESDLVRRQSDIHAMYNKSSLLKRHTSKSQCAFQAIDASYIHLEYADFRSTVLLSGWLTEHSFGFATL